VPKLQGEYVFLDAVLVRKVYNDIFSRFYTGEGNLKPHLQALSKQMNIEYAEPDEVKEFLSSLEITNDEAVRLIWRADEAGISIIFRDFVQYYDDLWYPSSDDVWVVEESLSWLLEFDHEEFIAFTKP
jgi:hypothetical protein